MTTGREELSKFLSVLWPDLKETGYWLLFWGTPSKRSEWVQSITDDTLSMLEAWAEKENVYVGCGLRSQNHGPTLRGDRGDIVALPGLYLDVDYGKEHKKPNLPPTEEDAMGLIADMGTPPTMIVHSGRGLQAWWCFREPWLLDSDEERAKAERLTKGWCTTLRARAKFKGWDADQVGDLPRVMRLPGLWNRKGVPKKTRLQRIDEGNQYQPDEFETYLVADLKDKEAVANLKWTFKLDLTANPPAEKFALLMDIDKMFKLSWVHARTDLQDQSASSYDLSLATRALAANWAAQEIVDLLIAHRRKHGALEKAMRPDYFERTLNRAITGKDQQARKEAVEALKAGTPVVPPQGETEPDAAETLGILSDLIGIRINKLVRFRGGSNTYQLDVEGHTIDVPAVELLDSQPKFRRLILDYTDKRIEPMKERPWHEFVNRLFSAIENVQVSSDATRKGAYENWVDMYMGESVAGEKDWERAACDNMPFYKDGHSYFVAEGFRLFLYTRFQERITSQQLTVDLTKLGYVYERVNARNRKGGRTKRSVWRVP